MFVSNFQYFGLPLLVNLDCAERQIGKDHDLTIRVLAVDQNRKDSSLKYQWTCELIDGNFHLLKLLFNYIFQKKMTRKAAILERLTRFRIF